MSQHINPTPKQTDIAALNSNIATRFGTVFKFKQFLNASNSSISGNGLYIVAEAVAAGESGYTNGIVFDIIYISGNRYAYTLLGGNNSLKSLMTGVSNGVMSFSGIPAWLGNGYAVYQITE